jgi:hypothetical protein
MAWHRRAAAPGWSESAIRPRERRCSHRLKVMKPRPSPLLHRRFLTQKKCRGEACPPRRRFRGGNTECIAHDFERSQADSQNFVITFKERFCNKRLAASPLLQRPDIRRTYEIGIHRDAICRSRCHGQCSHAVFHRLPFPKPPFVGVVTAGAIIPLRMKIYAQR